jgi:hypothetical protein
VARRLRRARADAHCGRRHEIATGTKSKATSRQSSPECETKTKLSKAVEGHPYV